MAHTDKDEVLALAIEALLITNKVALGLQDVLYGDHVNVPKSPTIIVMPLGKVRELEGVAAPGGRTKNKLMVGLEVLVSKVQDERSGRVETDALASVIEDFLHNDTTVGGILIHGFVTQTQRGNATFSSGMFQSVRMSFEGTTKTYLL